MSKALVSLNNIQASYNGDVVLRDVNFEIREKDFTGIIGPNGGGKTTLLKVILGLLKPVDGEIISSISKHDIGYLPQQNQLDAQFPITVMDVILSGTMEGGTFRNKNTKARKEAVDEVLDMVGVVSLKDRPIGELSGGELQRTMLGRAIVSSPKLLILDEPNTFVDNRFEGELYRVLKDLNDRMAILLVSHDVGMISPFIKSIACVNRNLHFHASNEISNEQLKVYNCPIELVTHGPVPHRVMEDHIKH